MFDLTQCFFSDSLPLKLSSRDSASRTTGVPGTGETIDRPRFGLRRKMGVDSSWSCYDFDWNFTDNFLGDLIDYSKRGASEIVFGDHPTQ